ncbi:hypothetical protein Bhyg_01816, partial [Pseudolycoriella hygida]
PKPAHFNTMNAQHRQVIAQAQAAVTKQVTEAELIRENYSQQHQTLAAHSGSYFDQSVTPVSAASLAWQAAQPLNHVNAILKSTARAPSPQSNAIKPTAVSSASNSGTYYHTSLPYGATGTLQTSYSPISKQSTSQQQHQQHLQQNVYANDGNASGRINYSGSNSSAKNAAPSRSNNSSQPTQLNRPANNVASHTSHQQQLPAQTQPTTSVAPKVLDNKFKPTGP